MSEISKDWRHYLLSAQQLDKAHEWMHKCISAKKCKAAIGGRFTYKITPTSLGTVIKIEDALTREEIDLSDYEDW